MIVVDLSRYRWHCWSIVFVIFHATESHVGESKEFGSVHLLKMDEGKGKKLETTGLLLDEGAHEHSKNASSCKLGSNSSDVQNGLDTGSKSASNGEAKVAEKPNVVDEGDWEDVEEESPTDPIKMTIVVNTHYKMSVGKTASQVAHAAVALYSQISSNKRWWRFLRDWDRGGSKKIVLDGQNTIMLKLLVEKCKRLNLKYCLVRDSGLTELPAKSLTAVAVIGRSSVINRVTGQFPLLK